jgi:UDP-glucose 4-epimerase
MTERVLVTGGAGFIGSHLVDRLLADKASVTVIDNFSTGRDENLASHAADPSLSLVRGSVIDEPLVDRLVSDHPLVFHLAAAVGVRNVLDDPVGSLYTNVRGTENVLASAHRHGSRVVLASTSEIYGRSQDVPFKEEGDRVLGPTWVHRWSYSTSKAVDEHLAFAYAERGLRISVVRYFNSYGPRIDESGYGSVMARFAAQALAGKPLTVHGDGLQSRCFTYVTDTVEGTILAARRKEALGNVINLGSLEEVSILDLAEMIRRMLGSSSPIDLVPYESAYPKGFQDTRRRVPDLTRARALLGFSPKVALPEGLQRTLAWCRANYAAAEVNV